MILLIDNYDSFSFNLYQLIGSIVCPGADTEGKDANGREAIRVIRNDQMTVEEIRAVRPDGILLSPGPGRPEDAGVCMETVLKLGNSIPILGVCLGHQSICSAFGAVVSYAKELMHGKQSEARLDTDAVIFRGCSPQTTVGRYHSLAAVEETMPDCLQVIGRTEDGEIMAVRHREYPIYGLQFHPESILTPEGPRMLRNWVESLGKNQ